MSGALITANEALEQGREVYVLAHDEDDIRAQGSRKLIDDGAEHLMWTLESRLIDLSWVSF